MFLDDVCQFEYFKLGIVKSDLVIFLNASFDLITRYSNNRKNNDGINGDIHESNLDFMRKIYDNALFVSDYFHLDTVKCDYDNKMRSITDIYDDVYRLVKKKVNI